MTLAPGTRLGHYEILGPLGAGGMGEVYRAHDEKLGRQVAVKVLPEAVASDRDRLARFEREAKTVATLSHPNILAIFEFGAQDGISYAATELLEGETLRQRLAGGALPIRKAIDYGVQMAKGLAAAHDKNVVHRDLKPENVFVTPDGRVKILDFGLARQGAVGSGDSFNSPTVTRDTEPGIVLGTVGYMSPEQVKGLPADSRCDIFSLGVVLYEMVSGQRAFRRASTAETMAAIMSEDPPQLAAILPDVHPGLARIVEHCLEKSPAERFQSARDLAFDLQALSGERSDSLARPRGTHSRVRSALRSSGRGFVLGSVVTGLAVWLGLAILPRKEPVSVTRLQVGVAPAEQLAADSGGRPTRTAMALSPNGRSLVFSAVAAGKRQLYVRRLDEPEAKPIQGTDGGANPFFSPDGQSVGYWARDELKRIPLGGGPAVSLCRVPAAVFGASWGADDRIVFARGSGGLWQVPAAGGIPTQLTALDASQDEVSHRLPHVLPGGDAVLFTVTRNRFPRWDETRIVLHSRRNGSNSMLIERGADARYVSSGHLVYVREGVLMAAPFDLARLEVAGGAVALEPDIMQAAYCPDSTCDTGAAQFSISESGTLVYCPGGSHPEPENSLILVDRVGQAKTLSLAPRGYVQPRLSPDGGRFAVYTQGRNQDIWIYEFLRGTLNRLTAEGRNASPVWTPDGKRVAYRSSVAGPDNLFWRPADGSGVAERLTRSHRNQVPASFSPDGQVLAFYELAHELSSFHRELWVLPLEGDEKPRNLMHSSSSGGADFSPDGRWLASHSLDSGRSEVYVQPYPGPGARQAISVGGGQSPIWRSDGREMFYLAPGESGRIRVMAVPVTTGQEVRAGVPKQLFEGPYSTNPLARTWDAFPDGQRFLMIETKQQPAQPITQMTLVLNWLDELKARVPKR